MDVKSESVARTPVPPEVPAPQATPSRRVTLFEREDIIQGVSPVLIAAIQKELVEMRLELEEKADNRIAELMEIAATERLDMERLRLDHQQKWETATGSTAASRRSSR